MIAVELLRAARSEGIQLALVDGRLTWTADRQPPGELLKALSAHKVEIVATLSAANDKQDTTAPCQAHAAPAPMPTHAPAAESVCEAICEPQRFTYTAATASPAWLAARDQYLNHIMACRACHAPAGRYCPTGRELHTTYNHTPMN